MIKVCVFDLDGTVMDTLESIAYFVNYTMKKMGLPQIETEKFKYFAGDGRGVLIHKSLAHNGADTDENFEIATRYYDEAYEADFMHLTKPFDNIITQLRQIKNRGIHLAVLSNKPHNVTGLVIEKTFGDKFFDCVYGQREGVEKKPSPEGFLAIAKQLGTDPGEMLMVGDTDVDMKTGVNAGAHTLGVLWGFRTRAELEQNGAEKLVATVEELEEAVLSF